MIKIQGLSDHQCDLLDSIWSFKDFDEFLNWQQTLSKDDSILSQTLLELLNQAVLDYDSFKPGFDLTGVHTIVQSLKEGDPR